MRGKKLFVLLALLLALNVVGFRFSGARAFGAEEPGLGVNERGTVIREELRYRGIGVNYFDAFQRTFGNPNDTSYRSGFQVLADHHIPYTRTLLGGFWPSEVQLYVQNKAEFFRRMDGVVKAAEENNVGMIGSLMWGNWVVPDVVGEHMDAWLDPQSRSRAFMEQYVADVVGRYKDSPAIFGWECGNEYNLSSDLPNGIDWLPPIIPELGTALSRDPVHDNFTSQINNTILAAFATAVRKADPYRIIVSGNSVPRGAAWHNTQDGSWQQDTKAQFAEVLLRDNPDPLNAICVHIYAGTEAGYFADGQTTMSGLMATIKEIAATVKKPVFLGEFGAPAYLDSANTQPNPDEHAQIVEIIQAIEENDIPLSAIWNFDRSFDDPCWSITADNSRGYMLDLIAAANGRIHDKLAKEGGFVPVELSRFSVE